MFRQTQFTMSDNDLHRDHGNQYPDSGDHDNQNSDSGDHDNQYPDSGGEEEEDSFEDLVQRCEIVITSKIVIISETGIILT